MKHYYKINCLFNIRKTSIKKWYSSSYKFIVYIIKLNYNL